MSEEPLKLLSSSTLGFCKGIKQNWGQYFLVAAQLKLPWASQPFISTHSVAWYVTLRIIFSLPGKQIRCSATDLHSSHARVPFKLWVWTDLASTSCWTAQHTATALLLPALSLVRLVWMKPISMCAILAKTRKILIPFPQRKELWFTQREGFDVTHKIKQHNKRKQTGAASLPVAGVWVWHKKRKSRQQEGCTPAPTQLGYAWLTLLCTQNCFKNIARQNEHKRMPPEDKRTVAEQT